MIGQYGILPDLAIALDHPLDYELIGNTFAVAQSLDRFPHCSGLRGGVAHRHHPADIAEDDSTWKSTAFRIATALIRPAFPFRRGRT